MYIFNCLPFLVLVYGQTQPRKFFNTSSYEFIFSNHEYLCFILFLKNSLLLRHVHRIHNHKSESIMKMLTINVIFLFILKGAVFFFFFFLRD